MARIDDETRQILEVLQSAPDIVSRELFRKTPDLLRDLRGYSRDARLRTQAGLASALGVTQPFISACENGSGLPSAEVALAWLMLLAHTADLSKLSADDRTGIEALAAAIPWSVLRLNRGPRLRGRREIEA
jgi:DNA-binding XRE family transcriptional regulator